MSQNNIVTKIKDYVFGINPVNKMYEGFFDTCNITSKTMGLEGSLAAISSDIDFQIPVSTKDGVSVCRKISFDNSYKNVGAYFAKQAAMRTLIKSGDSTTATLVFARDLVKGKKYNSKIREGIKIAQKEFEQHLKNHASIITPEKIKAIATVSVNNDKEIGGIIAEAYEKSSTVTVEISNDKSFTTLKVSQGFSFEKGWKNPGLVSNQQTATWEADDVEVILYEGNISLSNIGDIANHLNARKDKKPVLLVCEHASDDVMLNIVDSFRRQQLNMCVVEAPFFADQRQLILQDMATYTEGQVFIQGTSKEFKTGYANKVIVGESSCSIIRDEAVEAVSLKVAELKKQVDNSSDKKYTEKRITMLEGKAATILVGEISEGAKKELFDRCEDGVAAVKSAIQEGIIPGGGSALVFIAEQMKSKFPNKEIQIGYDMVKKCLSSPFKQVLSNAKINPKKFMSYSKKVYGQGYNLSTHRIEDLENSGVIDSAKSIRIALENAISVAILILNTKVII